MKPLLVLDIILLAEVRDWCWSESTEDNRDINYESPLLHSQLAWSTLNVSFVPFQKYDNTKYRTFSTLYVPCQLSLSCSCWMITVNNVLAEEEKIIFFDEKLTVSVRKDWARQIFYLEMRLKVNITDIDLNTNVTTLHITLSPSWLTWYPWDSEWQGPIPRYPCLVFVTLLYQTSHNDHSCSPPGITNFNQFSFEMLDIKF